MFEPFEPCADGIEVNRSHGPKDYESSLQCVDVLKIHPHVLIRLIQLLLRCSRMHRTPKPFSEVVAHRRSRARANMIAAFKLCTPQHLAVPNDVCVFAAKIPCQLSMCIEERRFPMNWQEMLRLDNL
jgi:hypothetical protein